MGAWWIDEPRVLGSSNPTEADLTDLWARGFRVLVCLLEPPEGRPRYDAAAAARAGWQLRPIPVSDFATPTLEQMAEFCAVAAWKRGDKVVVHCHAGVGRTGAMACAYWIDRGDSVAAAVARVRGARPGAVETDEQMRGLREFARVRARSLAQKKPRGPGPSS